MEARRERCSDGGVRRRRETRRKPNVEDKQPFLNAIIKFIASIDIMMQTNRRLLSIYCVLTISCPALLSVLGSGEWPV